MRKSEVISRISEITGLSKKASEDAINAYIDVIKDELQQSNEFQVYGLGTFRIVHKQARKARNIRTGEQIEVPAKNYLKFRASKSLEL